MTDPLGLTEGGWMWFARCGFAFLGIVSLAHAQPTWDPDAKPALTPQLIQSAFQRAMNPALSKAAGKCSHTLGLLGVLYNPERRILDVVVIKNMCVRQYDHARLPAEFHHVRTMPV